MKISVIIPTWNRAEHLSRALDSVHSQTRPPHEIIVVDDGSTDHTRERVRRHACRVRYCYQENRGVSSARNTGIGMASGDWIALLDSDDQWQPRKLQQQCEALRAHGEFLLCHSNEIWIRNGKRVNPMKKHAKQGGRIFRQCLPRCVISPSAALIHREVFDRIGYFDESLPACEDYDFWLRLCSSHPVLYLEAALVIKHGGHPDQLSRRYWGMDRFRIQALEKIIHSASLSTEDRGAALDTLLEKITIILAGATKRGNQELLRRYHDKQCHYAAMRGTSHATRAAPRRPAVLVPA